MSDLPAALQQPNSPNQRVYTVTSVTNSSALTLRSAVPSNQDARVGMRVIIKHNGSEVARGFIASVLNQNELTTTPISLPDHPLTELRAEIQRVWSPSIQQTTLINPNIFVGTEEDEAVLRAICIVPSNHRPGMVSWSLYKDSVEVIKGHDFLSPTVCLYTYTGLWDSGTYALRANRYDAETMLLVAEDTRTWVLDTPSPRLSCGGYNDRLTALKL